jgi:hypothetical protein
MVREENVGFPPADQPAKETMGRVQERSAVSERELVHGRKLDVMRLIVLVDAALRNEPLNVVVAVLIDLLGKRPIGHQR